MESPLSVASDRNEGTELGTVGGKGVNLELRVGLLPIPFSRLARILSNFLSAFFWLVSSWVNRSLSFGMMLLITHPISSIALSMVCCWCSGRLPIIVLSRSIIVLRSVVSSMVIGVGFGGLIGELAFLFFVWLADWSVGLKIISELVGFALSSSLDISLSSFSDVLIGVRAIEALAFQIRGGMVTSVIVQLVLGSFPIAIAQVSLIGFSCRHQKASCGSR